MGQLTFSRQRRDGKGWITLTHSRIRPTRYGIATTVNLAPLGLTVRDLRRRREALESAFRVEQVRIARTGPGRARLECRHTDPLASTVRPTDLPAARSQTGVVTRVDENGAGVEQSVTLSHLIVGAPGSGKSTDAWALLWALQRSAIPVRLRVFDPKQQEFAVLAEAAHDYGANLATWPTFLGHAVSALQTRQSILAGRGWQALSRFTDDDPLDLLIVDELLAVTKMRTAQVSVRSATMRADDALELLASQGRAAGFCVLGLAQLAQKDVLGQVRDLFSYVTCLRVPPPASEMVNMLLGDGAAEHYPAQEIPAGLRYAGVGYTRTESGLVVRTRGAGLSRDERAEVVRRVSEDTQRLRAVREAARARKSNREHAEAVV